MLWPRSGTPCVAALCYCSVILSLTVSTHQHTVVMENILSQLIASRAKGNHTRAGKDAAL